MAEVPRRTVLRGAGWAIPVVAIAVASPAAAASGTGLVASWLPAAFNVPYGGRRSVTSIFTVKNDSTDIIPAGALTVSILFNEPFRCDEQDGGAAWVVDWPGSSGGTATYNLAIPAGGMTQEMTMRPYSLYGDPGDVGTATIAVLANGLPGTSATITMTVTV